MGRSLWKVAAQSQWPKFEITNCDLKGDCVAQTLLSVLVMVGTAEKIIVMRRRWIQCPPLHLAKAQTRVSVPHRPSDLQIYKSTNLLIQHPRCFEDLFWPRADADIAGEIAPADGAGAVDEELGGAGDVVATSDAVFVKDAVSRNRRCLWIGEQREGVAGFLTEVARLFGRVDADRNRLHAGGAEIGETLFDTP
jgi:hypothetical protein